MLPFTSPCNRCSRSLTPVTQAEDAYAGIRSVFDATIANADHSGVVSGCALGNRAAELSTQDGDFRSEIHKLYERWKQAIAVRLREDSASQSRGYQNPEQVAEFVVAAFSGAILMAKASQDSAPLRSCWSQLSPLLKAKVGNGS